MNAAAVAGADIPDGNGSAFCDRLYSLANKIINGTAQTVDGLAVQARAITLASADLWECPSLHDGATHERRFIEAVCRFTRVSIPELNVQWADPIFQAIEEHRSALDVGYT